MSLESFMLEALERATETARTDGVVRPTFVIVSTEGVYHLVCPAEQSLRSESDGALQVVSALLRWSMARAFVITCACEKPERVAVYVVTGDGAQGFSIPLGERRLRLGRVEFADAPPYIRQLSSLIPSEVSDLSEEDILNLEDVFDMELEECQPYYRN